MSDLSSRIRRLMGRLMGQKWVKKNETFKKVAKNPPISKKSAGFWQAASIRIFCFSRFRHQSVEVTLIIFVLNDIDRFFRCQQLV